MLLSRLAKRTRIARTRPLAARFAVAGNLSAPRSFRRFHQRRFLASSSASSASSATAAASTPAGLTGAVNDVEYEDAKETRVFPPSPEEVLARAALEDGNTAEAYNLHDDAGALGTAGVLKKYGAFPVFGLGLAALISKEVYLLNEEVIVAACFGGLVFSGYVSLRETVMASFRAERDAELEETERLLDATTEGMKSDLAEWKSLSTLQADVKTVSEEHAELLARYAAVRPTMLKVAARDRTLALLNEQLRHESTEARKARESVRASASAHFDSLEATISDDQRSEVLESAIGALEGKGQFSSSVVSRSLNEFVTELEPRLAKLRSDTVETTQADVDALLAKVATMREEQFKAMQEAGYTDLAGVTLDDLPNFTAADVPKSRTFRVDV